MFVPYVVIKLLFVLGSGSVVVNSMFVITSIVLEDGSDVAVCSLFVLSWVYICSRCYDKALMYFHL